MHIPCPLLIISHVIIGGDGGGGAVTRKSTAGAHCAGVQYPTTVFANFGYWPGQKADSVIKEIDWHAIGNKTARRMAEGAVG